MLVHIQDAKKCFQDNMELVDPEKEEAIWNLNKGLLELCGSLEEMQRELAQIYSALHRLR